MENKTRVVEFTLKYSDAYMRLRTIEEGIEISNEDLDKIANDFLTYAEDNFERKISSKLNHIPIADFHDDFDYVLTYNIDEDDNDAIDTVKEISEYYSYENEICDSFEDIFVFFRFEGVDRFIDGMKIENDIKKKYNEISYKLISILFDSLQVTMETDIPEIVSQFE